MTEGEGREGRRVEKRGWEERVSGVEESGGRKNARATDREEWDKEGGK